MKTLLFQGDSITDCGRTGFPDKDDHMGLGYPRFIAAQLLGDQPEKDWKIFNRGISGNRVVDLYARWKLDTLNLNPDILSILIGVNDTWHEKARQNGVEVPRFDKFYRELLDWTLQSNPNIKFVLMDPFVLTFGAVDETWLSEINERREVVRKIAEDYKTVFVPLQDIFNEAVKRAPQEYWLRDGVHPTPAGHRLIQKAWLEAAAELIK